MKKLQADELIFKAATEYTWDPKKYIVRIAEDYYLIYPEKKMYTWLYDPSQYFKFDPYTENSEEPLTDEEITSINEIIATINPSMDDGITPDERARRRILLGKD